MQEFFGVGGELELFPIMQQADANRVFFYDAIDYEQGEKELRKTYEDRVRQAELFFSRIESLRNFHVHPGSVRRGRRRQQKEVDVLLTVDMMEFGFRGEMSKAVLVAGDIDFRPVVEALVRRGIFVDVWYDQSSASPDLPRAADFGQRITFDRFHSWNTKAFKDAHPIPREYHHAGLPYGDLIRTGSIGSCAVEFHRHARQEGTNAHSLWIKTGPGQRS